MTKEEYLGHLLKLKNEVYEEYKDIHFDLYTRDRLTYLKCMANKNLFLPYENENHLFFKEVIFHQLQAENDQQLSYTWRNTHLINAYSLEKPPYIFCTFHLGSYRLINHFLFKNNINYSLVINNKTLYLNKEKFFSLHHLFQEKEGCISTFNIIDAEEKNGIIQMIREIKKGSSLLFYMDGRTGIGGFDRADNKLTSVNLLDQKILSRKGIGFLSHLLNVPIIPLVSYRTEDTHIILEFFPAIHPNTNILREIYAKQSTQQLWDYFSIYLTRYPEQWEGWLYVDQFLDKQSTTTETISLFSEHQAYYFNKERYHFFAKDDKFYLFDGQNFTCTILSTSLFKILETIKYENVIKGNDLRSIISKKDLLGQLIQQKILITKKDE